MLNIEKLIENGKAVLTLGGRLDTVTAPELSDVINKLPEDTNGIVLDCKDLEYISSAGLRVLLVAHKAMSAREGLKLTNVNEMVGEVLEVTGFASVLNIEKAEE